MWSRQQRSRLYWVMRYLMDRAVTTSLWKVKHIIFMTRTMCEKLRKNMDI